ncbi:hypothetical protein [Gracilibacillus salinarum]|uniref:Uncharacterized protein n=1 Tax=Gracilibacillus salinarum TaxID=2932255 RepID=A0ABY4GKE5_9BACI|nr:hypothetical protein [Gracilibacillus salinarum]UOQ84679.1 hypothetical protein MUN87_18775 [Gracilibacillus salinarum]
MIGLIFLFDNDSLLDISRALLLGALPALLFFHVSILSKKAFSVLT